MDIGDSRGAELGDLPLDQPLARAKNASPSSMLGLEHNDLMAEATELVGGDQTRESAPQHDHALTGLPRRPSRRREAPDPDASGSGRGHCQQRPSWHQECSVLRAHAIHLLMTPKCRGHRFSSSLQTIGHQHDNVNSRRPSTRVSKPRVSDSREGKSSRINAIGRLGTRRMPLRSPRRRLRRRRGRLSRGLVRGCGAWVWPRRHPRRSSPVPGRLRGEPTRPLNPCPDQDRDRVWRRCRLRRDPADGI